jgi:hypothetical protein
MAREGAVVMLGAAAKHLPKDSPKLWSVVDKMLASTTIPSEAVQRNVGKCLIPLMKVLKEECQPVLDKLMVQLIQSPSYGDRKGAAFALAGVVKGVGIPWLTKGGVMKVLEEAIQDRKSVQVSPMGAYLVPLAHPRPAIFRWVRH